MGSTYLDTWSWSDCILDRRVLGPPPQVSKPNINFNQNTEFEKRALKPISMYLDTIFKVQTLFLSEGIRFLAICVSHVRESDMILPSIFISRWWRIVFPSNYI